VDFLFEDNMKQVSAALVKAQKAFGPALKSSNNPHFKTKYADLSACVEAVIDALNENGIALLQRNIDCESGVTVETVFVHESGEMLSSGPLHVPASKNDAQGYGSAQTYARRYSLMAACGIAPEDDDGNAATKTPTAKPAVLSSDQCEEITDLVNDVGADFEALMKWISGKIGAEVTSLKNVPKTAYQPIINSLKKKAEKAAA
jgi:hypothetical protein